jgi:SARP family transcriptional regulator, regulator of embCAB operon
MRISVLGAMTVSGGGRERPVRPNRVRAILAVLALSCGEVVSTDQIIDELWEQRSLGNARNALQANVARLRRFLDSVEPGVGSSAVRTSSHGYVLVLPADCVDVKVFEAQADHATELLFSAPLRAIAELEAALGMWRGTALLDAGGGLRCRVEATRLEERRLDVHKKLIEARMTVGADRGVVSELKQLGAEHPGDERLSELLMLALYRSGRQGEALAVFQCIRSWLDSELGLEPGPSLRRVQQAILTQDHCLDTMPVLVGTV